MFDLSPTQHWYLWAIIVGITCTVPCALLGCYLVLRRMSLLGDAISHGLLPGIVLGVLFSGQITGWPIILGAMAFGLLTAVLTQAVHAVADVPEDASMGVVFTGLFALGVVLVSQQVFQHVDLDVGCVLYGIFETIPLRVPTVLPTMLAILAATLVFVTLLWKELKIVAFDPGLATTLGINATVVHYLLMGMVAGVTVTAFEAVGSVLVVAMLIVPAATAHLLTDRLPVMMVLAALVAAIAAVGGVILSGPLLLDTNVAGMMAVLTGVQFALAVLFAPRHGILARLVRNAQLGWRIRMEDILAVLYRDEEARRRNDATTRSRLEKDLGRVTQSLTGRVALWSLFRSKMVQANQDEMELTVAGRQQAEGIVRSHRLWEAFLGQHFDLPLDHLHDPAERMEHFIGPNLQQTLAEELQKPEVDPHGRVIPPSLDDPS